MDALAGKHGGFIYYGLDICFDELMMNLVDKLVIGSDFISNFNLFTLDSKSFLIMTGNNDIAEIILFFFDKARVRKLGKKSKGMQGWGSG